jgi:hypothetical protein
MQKQLYVVYTIGKYTRCFDISIEHYKNINIIARKKLNTAKALKILDKL